MTYPLLGTDYPTSEARQAAAKAHPLWWAWRKFDATIHCGIPHMDEAQDRLEFEAFVRGGEAECERTAGGRNEN